MQERIDHLTGLLNKYPVGEINILYRSKEVELEIESFSKHPDVKWSESLKKKLIRQAKRKKISPGRQAYLRQLIQEVNAFRYADHLGTAVTDVQNIIDSIRSRGTRPADLALVHIEFDIYSQDVLVELYGPYAQNRWENKVADFRARIESAAVWCFLESNKFSTLSEQLIIVDVEDEIYPNLFNEIWELRVFELIRRAFQSKAVADKAAQVLSGNCLVEVGMHDGAFHIVFGK